MPIFEIDDRRYTFVHIPKTGGTSVEAWLAEHGRMSLYSSVMPSFMKCTPQHLTIDHLALVNPVPSEKSFCIVRDPYARAESEYFFRTASTPPALRPDFSVWTLQQLDKYAQNQHHLGNHFLPQAYFVNAEVRRFRFESGFESIFREVADYLGLPPPEQVKHLNGSRTEELIWSNELLDRFNGVYACDFEAFGYERRPTN